ncbi:MAG: class I SAM-dependent methyltransferase [Actinomycetia bacterium]|nr:class I SAM-dependent methyltransferase [Actinomycetes bacterium]
MTHSFDKSYWDQIWTGERATSMSTSEPNPHLIKEIDGLARGTTIDAGCGAGAEAIWLATQGWEVTGVDVSEAALAFADDRTPTGIAGQVEWVQADLSAWEPEAQYNLVTTHYAHPDMPQLDFYDRIASWVAPQGTLLIVGHLHHRGSTNDQRHEQGHGHGHTQPPTEASVTAAAITDRLDPDAWAVVTAEESQRVVTDPGGHPTTVHDVVVKATRRH